MTGLPHGPTSPQPNFKDPTSLLLLLVGAFTVAFGLLSHLVRGRFFVPSSVLATLLGIAIGPQGLQLLASDATDSGGWSNGSEGKEARELLRWSCQIVLAIQVLSAGVSLPRGWMRSKKNRSTLATLLVPTLAATWILCGLCVWLIVPGMTWVESLVVGACLGPTDPVLGGSVLKGHFAERHVDRKVRHVLLAESGANDGFGTPFLFLSLALLFRTYEHPPPGAATSTGGLLVHFLVWILLYNVVLSLVIGLVVGFTVKWLLVASRRKEWIDQDSMLVFQLAVALTVLGLITLIDANPLLACFTVGVIISGSEETEMELQTHFAEGLENVLDIVIFTVLGSVMPFQTWGVSASKSPLAFSTLAGLAVAIHLFRRLPTVLAFSPGLKSLDSWGKTLFVAWEGPMGIGALFYALEAADKIPESSKLESEIFAIVSFLVMTSIFIHGLSISFFLLTTVINPRIAPFLLGERTVVAEDFGRGDHLLGMHSDHGSAASTRDLAAREGDFESGQAGGEGERSGLLSHGQGESYGSRSS